VKHEFFDHHREGDSLVHQFDPRFKLTMMVLFILVVLLIPARQGQLFLYYICIPIFLALASKISIFHFLSKILKIYPMILIISIFIPFFSSGNDLLFQWGFLKVYKNGLEKFFMINVKSFLAIAMSVVLTTTTDMSRLLRGMEKLKIPPITISILAFMYRYIFLLVDEVEKMIMAFQSRYLKLSFLQRIKIFSQIIGILFIRTYERGERIYLAMESRGFRGKIHILNDLEWNGKDSIFMVIFLILIATPLTLLIL
jgi:cobalt/nickel transport system permease protein